jgi:nucleotide-binding universal stress UspA family protein
MANSRSIRTIVAASDFSTDAGAAVEWAAEIAREHAARLVLVHAAMVATPMVPEFIPLHETFYADLRAQARDELDRLAATLEETGVTVETGIIDAPAAAAVLDVAAHHRADLIAVGTRGLTGWKRTILGSVAARLVRKALCPVVTVHARDSGRHRPVRTILVPTDFSKDAEKAAEAAFAILGEGEEEPRLVLLHVYRYPLVLTPTAKPVLTASPDEVILSAHREMSALAKRFSRSGLRIQTSVIQGTPAEVILEQARHHGADLIAMGTHGRSGLDRLLLGSTAERVLSSAPCPILTVRDAD